MTYDTKKQNYQCAEQVKNDLIIPEKQICKDSNIEYYMIHNKINKINENNDKNPGKMFRTNIPPNEYTFNKYNYNQQINDWFKKINIT
ncbi:unnamed protein product [marine sediment metagenome]|uniref:Uncharacterized protein n=1 Tax=marine sediment metagenome TaxID=412755 RepID=X1SQH9_9ZZZZ